MRSTRVDLATVLVLAVALTACSGGGSGLGPPGGGGAAATSTLGQARVGITAAQLAAFERGRAIFEKDFRASEGLGPLYNTTSCLGCHSTPVSGGSSPIYRNFFLVAIGPPGAQFAIPGLPSVVVPAYGTGPHMGAVFSLTGGRAVIPDEFFGAAIAAAQRNALPMFGVGLFETISDASILANTDPDDLDGDGISGRFNTDQGSIGRLGVKAQSNNIELFTRAPLQNQMGITTDPFLGSGGTASMHARPPFQVSSDPNASTVDTDGVPDPELSAQDLGDLIAFSRFLAPPEKKPFSAAATRGEMQLESLGCAKCHIPTMLGSSGPVEAYTDLLIHDMGPALADGISMGVPQASAISGPTTESEFRTAPLWGVSLTAPFLHDGSADTLFEAIVMHGGEAEEIKQAFLALTVDEQNDLIAFLEAL